MRQLKPGDVVTLRSGGLSMTVEAVGPDGGFTPDGMVRVVWFETDDHGRPKLTRGFFARVMLDELALPHATTEPS